MAILPKPLEAPTDAEWFQAHCAVERLIENNALVGALPAVAVPALVEMVVREIVEARVEASP